MAGGVTTYVLRGGPCDGRIGQLSPAINQSGQLTCQNNIYKREVPAVVSGGHEVFRDAGAVPAPTKSATTPHTHKAWADLQHSVNVNLPNALRNANRSSTHALRALSKASRVRI